MHFTRNIIIGIAGGMGPQAGISLFNSILCRTKANKDQEHLSVVLMSFPGQIADRTAFLEKQTAVNPGFAIAGILKKLEQAGATIAGIACNTSYSPPIYQVIQAELKKTNSELQLLDMPGETCRFLKENFRGVRRIGVLSTNGTYKSGVYKNRLEQAGYEVIVPDFAFQDGVIHRMIYDPVFGLKARPGDITAEVRSLMRKAMLYFKHGRADAILLGCTDLSAFYDEGVMEDMIIIDSTDCLARGLVREALGAAFQSKAFNRLPARSAVYPEPDGPDPTKTYLEE